MAYPNRGFRRRAASCAGSRAAAHCRNPLLRIVVAKPSRSTGNSRSRAACRGNVLPCRAPAPCLAVAAGRVAPLPDWLGTRLGLACSGSVRPEIRLLSGTGRPVRTIQVYRLMGGVFSRLAGLACLTLNWMDNGIVFGVLQTFRPTTHCSPRGLELGMLMPPRGEPPGRATRNPP
jgi:hypothetical protein